MDSKQSKFETEEQFQVAAIMMIYQKFPALRGKVWHTKNESSLRQDSKETKEEFKKRSMREGNRNKAAGMLSGVHDILAVHNGILHKCELKLPGGKLSDSQKKLHELWDSESEIKTWVCYDLDEVFVWSESVVYCKKTIV